MDEVLALYRQAADWARAGHYRDAYQGFTQLLDRLPGNRLVVVQRDRAAALWQDLPGTDPRPLELPEKALLWQRLPQPPASVLVYEFPGAHSYGYGDAINWGRIGPELAAQGYHVELLPRRTLRRLFEYFQGCQVPNEQFLPEYDCYWTLASTQKHPYRLREPFLLPDKLLQEQWLGQLGRLPRPWIGIHWSGAAWQRALPIDGFVDLGRVTGATLISLQKGEPRLDLYRVPYPIQDFGFDLDPDPEIALLDTAAVVSQLDCVVTNDTSIGHVAGALGVRCVVVLTDNVCSLWDGCTARTPLYANHYLDQLRPGETLRARFQRIGQLLKAG